MLVTRVLIFTISIIFFSVSWAEDDPYNIAIIGDYTSPGFDESRAYDGDSIQELIDPFGGGLKLVYTDLEIVGSGGFSLPVLRTYNSLKSFFNPALTIRPINANTPPGTALRGRSVIGLGWDLHFGRIWTHLENTIGANNSADECGVNNVSSKWNPVLELADGSRKTLVNYDGTSYSLITSDYWLAKCLPASLDSNGVGGLLVYSPDGKIYTFNQRGSPTKGEYLPYLVTRIEDRNGNYFDISYINANLDGSHVLIDEVTSSGGRLVKFSYSTTSAGSSSVLIDKITSHGQIVEYEFESQPDQNNNAFLQKVFRPDASIWWYEYYNDSSDENTIGWRSIKQVWNPYGQETEYEYGGVDFTNSGDLEWVVTRKKVSGLNINTGTWNYSYAPSSTSDITTVKHDNGCTKYEHLGSRAVDQLIGQNNIYEDLWRQGILLSKETRTGSATNCGSQVKERIVYEWQGLDVAQQNEYRPFAGNGWKPNTFAVATATRKPLMTKRTITRDSTDFVVEYSNFDAYGNPKAILEKQSQSGDSRTRRYTYYLPGSAWLLHLVDTASIDGVSGQVDHNYDSKGNLLSENSYGLVTTYGYYSNGDMKYTIDADNHRTDYSDYYLGVPRREDRPEGVVVLRSVDDRANTTCEAYVASGSLCSTVSNTNKTLYSYDYMDRVKDVTTPRSDDNDVTLEYNYHPRYPGSYTQDPRNYTYMITRKRDNLTKNFIYDGTGNVIRDESVSEAETIAIDKSYDELGRLTFESHPHTSTGTSTTGNRFEYDALGRLEQITHDVDQSSIKYTYQAYNKVQVEDERNNTTTYEYLGYGSPDTNYLEKITAPEGQTTQINRLKSGLIDSVTQGGITHDYGYNSHWQLITETRPEFGTIAYGRDGRGNMISRQVSGEPATTFSYDGLGRLDTIDYPGTTADVTYQYDIRGNLELLSTGNLVWGYGYDSNDNLDWETLSISSESASFMFDYTYTGVLPRVSWT